MFFDNCSVVDCGWLSSQRNSKPESAHNMEDTQ
jgi:hypothetical protein